MPRSMPMTEKELWIVSRKLADHIANSIQEHIEGKKVSIDGLVKLSRELAAALNELKAIQTKSRGIVG